MFGFIVKASVIFNNANMRLHDDRLHIEDVIETSPYVIINANICIHNVRHHFEAVTQITKPAARGVRFTFSLTRTFTVVMSYH